MNKPCTYVPGLFKIFDEIIVNAADNKQRDPSMSKIDVTIDPAQNKIRVWNNGRGIPVAIHQEHNIYVAELIFGNLLTGSNFDDQEEKTTGGRNGYGAKLANIFSTKFIVETADSSRGLKYVQEFKKNMSVKSEPKISKYDGSDYTCITFYPDLARFRMEQLDEDIIGLLAKRVHDIAATNNGTGAKLRVHFNGERLDVQRFEPYLEMFEGIEPPVYFTKINERWEVGVGFSDGSFQHISFVNSISTSKGGTHVNYVADKIVSRLASVVKKRNKGEEVKPNQIKNHLAIFVNCLIVNPAFDSQTKENLTTKAANFGSSCEIPDKMIKAIEKSQIIDNILSWSKLKQSQELKRKSGTKTTRMLRITKLDDANFAGTSKSSQCTLILTEGDSAKALAISGLGVVGRDFYGVFPLKGKLLNVREASHAQIMKNEEIQNITKILGLSFGKEYTDTSSLRYGHLMIMTDQDHDGSHIKGLLINFLHHFWPSLLHIDGFLQQFITPIVKCSKGKIEIPFYTIPEYKAWRESHDDGKGWKIKYYKGLGTSTAAEAKDYFSNLGTHEVAFRWDDQAADMIEMAFAKKRVEDRKLWLLAMEPGIHINYKSKFVTYDNFVNHELILFSHADNERSIAHFMDGMKPSQRKVLYSCFKRNLRQEIKVAQLAGYVSEHSAYHHGEASLTQTIIGMAQNFVGSNNINLLSPCGQFGTRLMGGKDAASPRYVFTKLENVTRALFHPHDDPLLEYLEDDGQQIEPLYYVPIIPMALVNGCEGIGTGWSSSVPTYNPRELIANLRRMIAGEEPEEMLPWFRGFTGTVQQKAPHSYLVTGTLEEVDEQTVRISELPVGRWTTDYKQFLEGSLIGGVSASTKDDKDDNTTSSTAVPFVKDFKENHTDTTVLFTVTLPADKLSEFDKEKGGLIKKFKLDTTLGTTNMNLFDLASRIKKYDGPLHLLREFFQVRMQYYDHRKGHLINQLTIDWEKLDNKVRFLLTVIQNDIVVANRKKIELLNDIRAFGLKPFYEVSNRDTNHQRKDDDDQEDPVTDIMASQSESGADAAQASSLEKGYDYLLSLKLWNLTMEKVQELIHQRDAKHQELEDLKNTTAEGLWLRDLQALELALDEYEAMFDEAKALELAAQKKAKSARAGRATAAAAASRKRATAKKPVAKKAKKKHGSESDEDSAEDDTSSNDDGASDDDEDWDSEDAGRKKPLKRTTSQQSKSSDVARVVSVSSTTSATETKKASTSKNTSATVGAVVSTAEAKPSTLDQWLGSGSANKPVQNTLTTLASSAVEALPTATSTTPREELLKAAEDGSRLSLLQRLQSRLLASPTGSTPGMTSTLSALSSSASKTTVPSTNAWDATTKSATKRTAIELVDSSSSADEQEKTKKPPAKTTAKTSSATSSSSKRKRQRTISISSSSEEDNGSDSGDEDDNTRLVDLASAQQQQGSSGRNVVRRTVTQTKKIYAVDSDSGSHADGMDDDDDDIFGSSSGDDSSVAKIVRKTSAKRAKTTTTTTTPVKTPKKTPTKTISVASASASKKKTTTTKKKKSADSSDEDRSDNSDDGTENSESDFSLGNKPPRGKAKSKESAPSKSVAKTKASESNSKAKMKTATTATKAKAEATSATRKRPAAATASSKKKKTTTAKDTGSEDGSDGERDESDASASDSDSRPKAKRPRQEKKATTSTAIATVAKKAKTSKSAATPKRTTSTKKALSIDSDSDSDAEVRVLVESDEEGGAGLTVRTSSRRASRSSTTSYAHFYSDSENENEDDED